MEFNIDLRELKATGEMSELEVIVASFVFGLGITLGVMII